MNFNSKPQDCQVGVGGVEKSSPIEQSFQRLFSSVDGIECAISSLNERLSRVIGARSPIAATDDKGPVGQSTVSEQLFAAKNRLDNLTAIVRGLAHDLEV